MSSPVDQSRYQVRFEWGIAGLERLAASDIVVVVDVLASDAGDEPDAARSAAAVARAATARAGNVFILRGAVSNASAVAAAILAEQQRRAARTSIAVIACGADGSTSATEASADGDEGSTSGALRFAVEDLLGAGAVIDALGALGIDHTSPEAAAACEAFRGLRAALRHLFTASGSGQALLEEAAAVDVAGAAASGTESRTRDAILAAAQVDASASVLVWREGGFATYD